MMKPMMLVQVLGISDSFRHRFHISNDSMAGAWTWLTFLSSLPVLPPPLAHLQSHAILSIAEHLLNSAHSHTYSSWREHTQETLEMSLCPAGHSCYSAGLQAGARGLATGAHCS